MDTLNKLQHFGCSITSSNLERGGVKGVGLEYYFRKFVYFFPSILFPGKDAEEYTNGVKVLI